MTNEQKTEAPERIDLPAGGQHYHGGDNLIITCEKPDLAQPMCAAVKPLEWVYVKGEWLADVYRLQYICDDVWIVIAEDVDLGRFVRPETTFTLEEAKAAAQVDYTRRITEALDIRTVESVLQGVCYILTSSHEDPKLDYGCDTLRDDEDTYISVEWVKRVFERYTREAK